MKRREINHPAIRTTLSWGLILVFSALQYVQMQYSALPALTWIFRPGAVNTLFFLCFNCLLMLAVGRIRLALAVSCLVVSLWSIANHFVVMFHGSPIFVSELGNFLTAMDVAGTYSYSLDVVVVRLLIAAGLQAGVLGVHWLFLPEQTGKKMRMVSGLAAAGAALALYVTLLSPFALKPGYSIKWSWIPPAEQYGLMPCLLEDAYRSLSQNKILKPEGYDAAAIDSCQVPQKADSEYPDIIVILNETFYDLSRYTDLRADTDLFAPLCALQNASCGIAVAPGVGGRTNDAEFELLTSCSKALLADAAPFNYIDLTKMDGHAVKLLHALGYTTAGMHCASAGNYRRATAYPALGFDTIKLGTEFFTDSAYGNRRVLDSENFRDLEKTYEQMGDGPRFIYLLTYQNHGGYEQNDGSLDTVHIANDFGALTDDVEEYLTSVSMSVNAFVELTEYYAQTDRNVVIAMVGDHAPSFITDLPRRADLDDDRAILASRSTPFILWSNYGVDCSKAGEAMTMTDMMPLLFDAAGLPVSVYYQTIIDLHGNYPLRSGANYCVDSVGQPVAVEDLSIPQLRNYYYMEYNYLTRGEDYRAELFALTDGRA